MTIKYGYSKLALGCASFLAFAGLSVTAAARQLPGDSVAAPAEPVRVQRIIIVEPSPTEVPTDVSTEVPPVVQAAPAPVIQVPVPQQRPVTRTRGS